MIRMIKKYMRYGFVVSMGCILSACGSRTVPDELAVVIYKPLENPPYLSLPTPVTDGISRGYESARSQVLRTADLAVYGMASDGADTQISPQILSVLKLDTVDMAIDKTLQNPLGDRVVVLIKKEQARLADNKRRGVRLSDGDVPRIKYKRTRSGTDTLFN